MLGDTVILINDVKIELLTHSALYIVCSQNSIIAVNTKFGQNFSFVAILITTILEPNLMKYEELILTFITNK